MGTPVTPYEETQLKALDLFCCAGGATKGYQEAGFYVVGVDFEPQPNYCGDELYQADALGPLPFDLDDFDLIHASPPCQRFSDLAHRNGNGHQWPDLIGPTRDLLEASGRPYVIENVEGAPLRDPAMLCGTMFPGLRVIRHRLFEASFPIETPEHGRHPLVFTHDKRKAHYGRLNQDTSFVQVTGGGNCTVANARDAMGAGWMTKAELNEAIPPAFTEWVGSQFIDQLAYEETQ
jgi:DNA (cytosine-5)-methyltransferase 1